MAWRRHNVVWLAGVRRVGKTMLCQSLDAVEYFDCERPAVRRQMADPEVFLKSLKGKRAALMKSTGWGIRRNCSRSRRTTSRMSVSWQPVRPASGLPLNSATP